MKRPPKPLSAAPSSLAARPLSRRERVRVRAAFTLVEMLVVITIIGILVALTVPAVHAVRVHAINAAISLQMSDLEMACQKYKAAIGEYPPDFTGINLPDPVGAASRAAVLRHLAKAFPRYQPADWAAFALDVQNNWGLNVNTLNAASAITFWLGGQPDWTVRADGTAIRPGDAEFTPAKALMPVRGFLGFSADPTNPFAASPASPSRIAPFFDFDLACLYCESGGAGHPPAGTGGILLWPTRACNKTMPAPATIIYFRANNGTYFCEGSSTVVKSCGFVYAAADSRLSNFAAGSITWINPNSMQIFSAGRDVTYSQLVGNNTPPAPATDLPLRYPSGENCGPGTFDDITNFSGGKLEDRRP